MIPVSSAYIQDVYDSVREFRARATINMSAFTGANIYDITTNFVNKVAGSTVENGNIMKAIANATLQTPTGTWTEVTQASYDLSETLDSQVSNTVASVSGQIPQRLFSFDIIRMLEDRFGKNVWTTGAGTALSAKITQAQNLITKYSVDWYGWGTTPTTTKASISFWNTTSGNWTAFTPVVSTANTITQVNKTITTLLTQCIDTNGFVHVLVYGDPTDGVTQSVIRTDAIFLTITAAQTTIRTYDDTNIIRLNIVEEVNVLNDSLPANELSITLDNQSGEFNVLGLGNMSQIIASKPTIMVELGLVLDSGAVEWIPSGKFFIIEWKNDITTRIITFTAQDYFRLFSNISYDPTSITKLGDLAKDVITKAGVPLTNQRIDLGYLNNLPDINPVSERTDSRTVLQNVGIAGQTAIFQDRYGNLNIKTFAAIDQTANYIIYPKTQGSLYGSYPNARAISSGGIYSFQGTDSGLRYIDGDQMYDYPEVTLAQSVYQLVIKVYATVGVDPTELTYINTSIGGNSGISYEIDNPLVKDSATANRIANWYFRESNYNAIYRTKWRQNPAIECIDIVLIEDAFQANKQTRIYHQEFTYEGYLEGNTESRGGI